jgi:hypothetical protein
LGSADIQETIEIVQRGIEGLSTIDPDRMTFKIQLGTGESQHWAKVLDEAWERFDADPPERLAVVVADAPGDDHLRMSPLFERADLQVRGKNGCIISTRSWPWSLLFCLPWDCMSFLRVWSRPKRQSEDDRRICIYVPICKLSVLYLGGAG